MDRRLALLVAAVMISALAVVDLRQRNRMDFVVLQALRRQRENLNVERGKLLLEEGVWSEHRRVEFLARRDLGMSMPKPDQVVIVDIDGGQR
ncbi:MAG: cell division protein FtsL [Pseudomonadota bacterium]|nr:cell division protein FtsL [Pseudomonadota bacterium]